MRPKPRIGFVILVWNSEKVIGKCLQSICTLQAIEPHVVVVDNGSTDSSSKILEEFAQESPFEYEKIQYNINRGTTISRNEGIKRLLPKNLDYYCILDSDTEINNDAFLALVEEMANNPEYGIIGPTMVTSCGMVQMSARRFPTVVEKLFKAAPFKSLQAKGEAMEVQWSPNPDLTSYPVDYLMSACWLIRPEVLQKAGLLDEKIFYAPEDVEYCIRVWKSGYQVAFCPKAQIIHEWQRLSKKKLISKMNWEHIKGLLYMFHKHHFFFSTDKLKESFVRQGEINR